MSSPAPLDIRSAVDPAWVGVARRALRRWLRSAGGEAAGDELEDAVDDLVLATSEALENVVDHAFADAARSGSMSLHADVRDGTVTVVVADDGSWREPRTGPTTRGRGLLLMENLAEAVVDHGSHGTTVTLRRQLPAPDRAAARA